MREQIATTTDNHSLELIKLGPRQAPVVLLIGGVHGDEPEGIWLVEEFLKSAQHEAARWNVQAWTVPNMNPDGSQNNQRTNGRGVDLNRNFPVRDWSKEAKAPRYFPGENPGSEIETQTIVKLIDSAKPILIIHCHSWKPQICCTGEAAMKWGKILADGTGYPLTEDIGYPTPGSLGQFGWVEKKTPVICIEMQEGIPHADVTKVGLKPLLDLFRSFNA